MIPIINIVFLVLVVSFWKNICSQVIEQETSIEANVEENNNIQVKKIEDISMYELMYQCFKKNEIKRTESVNIHTKVFFNSTEDPVIVVNDWIDEIFAYNVLILTTCVKNLAPKKYEYRPFEGYDYGIGNNVTYMNEILQTIYPELIHQIMSVSAEITDRAGWRPHPYHLGIRCIELLEYSVGGELKWHTDHESIYTISIMISDPSSFEGGAFYIRRTNAPGPPGPLNTIEVYPKRYGGVLFDSNVHHGVSPMKSGDRTVLVFELWPYYDSTFDDYRPKASQKPPKIPQLLKVPTNTVKSNNYDDNDNHNSNNELLEPSDEVEL